jgi:hypothetical protein
VAFGTKTDHKKIMSMKQLLCVKNYKHSKNMVFAVTSNKFQIMGIYLAEIAPK